MDLVAPRNRPCKCFSSIGRSVCDLRGFVSPDPKIADRNEVMEDEQTILRFLKILCASDLLLQQLN